MSLEISFTPNSSARPQNLSLQDGESIQVFSGESFQIQNPEIVAQLVPQDKDLQIVCHDGTSFILKNFLEVDFATEPVLQLQGGAAITWHDFVQQTEGISQAFNIDDTNNPTLAFAPLLVIAATAESPEWSFAEAPPLDEDSSEATIQTGQSSQSTSAQPKEKDPIDDDSSFSKASPQNIDEAGIKLASYNSGTPQSDNPIDASSNSGTPGFIEIDIRKFLDITGDGTNPPPSITGVILGGDEVEIEVDDITGIAIIPKDIFKDDNSVNINIIVDDGTGTKNTTITITETKDGGGETFHLILSQNEIVENREGALIGKLDTDDAGRGHTYEYTLSKDSSNLFEIKDNVLKLKDRVSIDYEAHPESYPIRIVATDELGNEIEQTMDIWPKDVNEIASVSSIDTSTLEDVRVTFDPDDFDTAFDDEDSDYLEMVRMDTLPENGTLSLGDDPVIIGQLIDYEQIEELSFQPNANWNGDTSFQWSGFDGAAWSAESSPVSISIEAVNDAPVVSVHIGQQATATDEVFTMNLPENAFVDVDSNDTLSYSAELPSGLNIDSETGTISGTSTDEHIGDQDITITATDTSGESTSQTFRLTIENTNDGPVVSSSIENQNTSEDSAFSLNVSGNFSDEDLGDKLSYSATLENGDDLPEWLSIDSETGELSGIPANRDVGDIAVTITASDGEATASDTFSVTVENTNHGPTVSASIDDQTTDEGSTFSLDVSDNFADEDSSDTLSYTAELTNESGNIIGDGSIPTWLSFDSETGQFSGTPGDGDESLFCVKVTASDGESSVSDIFAIDVDTLSDPDQNITGTKNDDEITTGSGNDIIDGGKGGDTIDAGDGDDTITIDYGISSGGGGSGSGSGKGSGSGSGSGGNFGAFDGGDGEDMLEFNGSNLKIDLTVLDNGAIQNIERLDIDGSGSNNLRLSSDDVLDMTDGDNKLLIDGGSDDHVEISDDFQSEGTHTSDDGVDYNHYYDAGTDSHLYINNNITDLDTF